MFLPKSKSKRGGETASTKDRHPSGFDKLPSEIATLILSFLTETKDVLSARSVCKQWDLIVMNPRPVVARIRSPRDFVRLVKVFSLYAEQTIPFSLSGGTLFATTASESQFDHGEAEFSVDVEGFERKRDFLLHAKPLAEFLKTVGGLRWNGGEKVLLALFERVSKVAVVFSGKKERRLSTHLTRMTKDWVVIRDTDCVLKIPLDADAIASIQGNGQTGALLTAETADTPAGRIVACTLDAGRRSLVGHFFSGTGESALSPAFDRTEDVVFEPLLAVRVRLGLLRKVCKYLRGIGGVNWYIPASDAEDVPILLERDDGSCRIKWIIAPMLDQ